MSGGKDHELAALDAYIRAQLREAAETFTSQADLDARLEAIFNTGRKCNPGGTPPSAEGAEDSAHTQNQDRPGQHHA